MGLTIAVITPWQDHLELAADYFDAVVELEEGDENIIVDNGSMPPLPFGTLQPGLNLGFSVGCNVGLEAASTDAVLFLNNDIKLARRGWLAEIREALEPDVLVGRLRYDHHADVDGQQFPYLDGWCLAGMREDLLELGGFDTTLMEPAYYSDNLLCLEARAAGMTLREVDVGLFHKENQTAGRPYGEQVRKATLANRERYQARAWEALAFA